MVKNHQLQPETLEQEKKTVPKKQLTYSMLNKNLRPNLLNRKWKKFFSYSLKNSETTKQNYKIQ